MNKSTNQLINQSTNQLIILFIIAYLIFNLSVKQQSSLSTQIRVIGKGQMPNITKDKSGNFHLVYGTGDSIMYVSSSSNGKKFSQPALVAVLPDLAASHTRGPQVAASSNGLTVIACNQEGNIFSFRKGFSGKWYMNGRVNDMDTVAKEGLIALAANDQKAVAVWLDLRSDSHNKLVGSLSNDGGKTWLKNNVIYASPDKTVCECCKPSVQIKGNMIYVMFRNWLNGNRDLYIMQSTDGGEHFDQPQKLGMESWTLNACPMDGGGLVINKEGIPQTVWRRKNKIYASRPGMREIEIGEGRSCTIETVDGKNVYAWVDNGDVIILNPQGIRKNLGKGKQPLIRAINNEHIICVWENNEQIYSSVVEL